MHGSDFIVLELPRTGRAVCIRLSGLSEEDGSIATRSRIATVIDAIAAGSPSRSSEFSAVLVAFYLQQERNRQFIFLHSCVID